MKIPIKLKSSELLSLVELLDKIICIEECTTRQEAIVVTLMVKFYMKLKSKSIMIEKPMITFTVEPETAMAFVEFFIDIPYDNASHAGNTVNKLISNYDKQTANFY